MKPASHFSTSAFSKVMFVILCLLVAAMAGAQFALASPGRSLVVEGGSTACGQADIPVGLGGEWGCTQTPTTTATETETETVTESVTVTPTSTPTQAVTETPTPTATSTTPGTSTPTGTATPTVTLALTETPTPTATPTASNTSTPTETATVTPTPTTSNTSTPTGTATVTPTPTATTVETDLSISKSESFPIGNTITFTVVARNLGPNPADGAVITDSLTADLYDATWSCVSVPSSICAGRTGVGAIQDTLVVFPVGGTITYTMPTRLYRWYFFRNTAEIVAPRGDLNPSNNIAMVDFYTVMLMLVLRDAQP